MSQDCDICGRQFMYASILKLHYRSHTGEKPFRCVFCEKTFSHEAHLMVHRRIIHLQRKRHPSELFSDENSNLEQRYNLEKDERKCIARKEVLTSKNDLNSCFTSSHASTSCSISNKGFSKNSGVNKPTQSYGKKKYKSRIEECLCDRCGEMCSSKSNLKTHYRIHTKEKLYVCNICGKAYTRNHNLKLHYRVHNERPFACVLCGKAFDQLSKLKDHCCSANK